MTVKGSAVERNLTDDPKKIPEIPNERNDGRIDQRFKYFTDTRK